jgi:hypothetical protein
MVRAPPASLKSIDIFGALRERRRSACASIIAGCSGDGGVIVAGVFALPGFAPLAFADFVVIQPPICAAKARAMRISWRTDRFRAIASAVYRPVRY